MSDELKDEVKAKVLQYLAGSRLETNKLEFKKQWYTLTDVHQKNEFYKDTTALVNSYGGDDAFIVFGVDESTRTLVQARLSDSGYNDAADVKNIIDSNIDKPFRFEIDYVTVNNTNLCVFHIHPSTDKPHVILKYKDRANREYSNEIFIRSGSAKVVAGKADIDRMYIERNTIIVERKADISIYLSDISLHEETAFDNSTKCYFSKLVAIENRGSRVLNIYKIALDFTNSSQNVERFAFDTILGDPMVIEPNRVFIKSDCIFYHTSEQRRLSSLMSFLSDVVRNRSQSSITCQFHLATGEIMPASLYEPESEPPPMEMGIISV